MGVGPHATPRWRRWSAVLTVAVLLLAASVVPVPGERVPAAAGGLSVFALLHVLGYAALAGTLAHALADRPQQTQQGLAARPAWQGLAARPTWQGLAAVFLVTVACGAAIEVLQGSLPYRLFSYRDIGWNALGAAVGTVAGWRLSLRESA